MTPSDLARIHAASFQATRAWTASELEDLLADPATRCVGSKAGFALARMAATEAEILTIAVMPDVRRAGHGRQLLADLEARIHAAGVRQVFLEVASDNTAGRALYASAGYGQVGIRPNYYAHPDGSRTDACVMMRVLPESY